MVVNKVLDIVEIMIVFAIVKIVETITNLIAVFVAIIDSENFIINTASTLIAKIFNFVYHQMLFIELNLT